MAVKESRGGKYHKIIRGFGYYGNGNAGVVREFLAKNYGTPREFVGSGLNEYSFYKKGIGILTVFANSYEEALRIARSRRYTSRNYMR